MCKAHKLRLCDTLRHALCDAGGGYKVCACVQTQQSEVQSLLRLTESTEEGQSLDLPSSSFRALVLDRGIPDTLARYATALFTVPDQTQDLAESEFKMSTPAGNDPAGSAEVQSGEDVDVSSQQADPSDVATTLPAVVSSISEAASMAQQESKADASSCNSARQTGSNEGRAAAAGKQEAALCEKGSEQWVQGIGMAGLPWALQLLAAFARGHQVCFHSRNSFVSHLHYVCVCLLHMQSHVQASVENWALVTMQNRLTFTVSYDPCTLYAFGAMPAKLTLSQVPKLCIA